MKKTTTKWTRAQLKARERKMWALVEEIDDVKDRVEAGEISEGAGELMLTNLRKVLMEVVEFRSR